MYFMYFQNILQNQMRWHIILINTFALLRHNLSLYELAIFVNSQNRWGEIYWKNVFIFVIDLYLFHQMIINGREMMASN